MEVKDRLAALRTFMKENALAAFIVPSTDPHSGEYVPEHWEARKWISGFTGSAGTAVITGNQAGLWTDSRYFIQASQQLEGSGIALFKDRLPETPSIAEWLGLVLPKGSSVGIDGWVNATAEALTMKEELERQGLQLVTTDDPFEELWTDRPALPSTPLFLLPLSYTGEACNSKINRIRQAYRSTGAEGLLVSALDEVAWTLNLRGNDVHCNPVFVSYLLITDTDATLYINKEKLNGEVCEYLSEEGVRIKDYKDVYDDVVHYRAHCLLLPEKTNYAIYQAAGHVAELIRATSPIVYLKAVKNDTEMKGFENAMRKDGVAMVKFLRWIKEAVKSGQETEISIDRQLEKFRAEQEGFKGISFDTIAGYQAHGAIVHYEATEETAATLQPEGLLLLDSGGQYLDGTTDITRTIALGEVSEEQKTDYTLVLKGMIALSKAVFPKGTCGTQLDVLARQFMWAKGINYGHGTGHGVGHFLNVHEGPHQFRMNYVPAQLVPGMTVTNEPGIYKEGKYGIRIENTMRIVYDQETEFGEFYRFAPLTICPIEQAAIRPEMMSAEEKEWLNDYHQFVYDTLSPFLDVEEKEWLLTATQKI